MILGETKISSSWREVRVIKVKITENTGSFRDPGFASFERRDSGFQSNMGRNSGLKVCTRDEGCQKITGITGLSENSGQQPTTQSESTITVIIP